MSYVPFRYRLPGKPPTDPATLPLDHSGRGRSIAFMTLPMSAVLRLDDAAVALHLFEEAQSGNVPAGLPNGFHGLMRVPRLLAAAFVDSLMGAGRFLRRFGELDGQASVIKAADGFFIDFPDLIDLRDSVEHEDERLQFRARNKTIPAPTITLGDGESTPLTEDNVFFGAGLSGNTFQATVRDGRLGRLEISQTSLRTARLRVQTVFDATGRIATGYDWPHSDN